jgi:hypothetical protein
MDMNKIADISKAKQHISGSYNYCDRWCERCPQTSRCLTYSIAEEKFADPESRDLCNEAFWKKISGILQDTIKMIAEQAAELGIDLDTLNVNDAEEQSVRAAAEGHDLSREAREYIDMVDDWFDMTAPLFGEKGESEIENRLSAKEIGDMINNDLEEALTVVRWYQHQIFVKLMRALSGMIEEPSDPSDNLEEFAKDSDGSAKVSLIGIDRSLASWKIINDRLPGDDIRHIMKHLLRLRNRVEKVFPDARGFIRPGFDHIDLNS